jgi:hypothetical protein
VNVKLIRNETSTTSKRGMEFLLCFVLDDGWVGPHGGDFLNSCAVPHCLYMSEGLCLMSEMSWCERWVEIGILGMYLLDWWYGKGTLALEIGVL